MSGAKPDADEAGFASPACQAHEADPAYMGYLARCEVADLATEILGRFRKPCAEREALAELLKRLPEPKGAAPAGHLRARLARVRDDGDHAVLRAALDSLEAMEGPTE